MKKSEVIKIIKEEIKGYEYLQQEEMNTEQSEQAVLNSEEFQNKLIQDTINKRVKWKSMGYEGISEPEPNEDNVLDEGISFNLDVHLKTKYPYMGQPYDVDVIIEGHKIPVFDDKFGDYYVDNYADYVDIVMSGGYNYDIKEVINDAKHRQEKDAFVFAILGRQPWNY